MRPLATGSPGSGHPSQMVPMIALVLSGQAVGLRVGVSKEMSVLWLQWEGRGWAAGAGLLREKKRSGCE